MICFKNNINRKGFTLVELLLVLVLIGIILIITVPNIMEALDANKQESGKSIEKVIINNLGLYNKDHEKDLWISNAESNRPKCINISYSELLGSNEDIKLGECLLNDENSLTIEKTDNGKYKYYAGITCGKGLIAKGNSGDDKYIIQNANTNNIYYHSNSVPCDKNFKLTAVLNDGNVINKYDWQGENELTKTITSGDKYGNLPQLGDKGNNAFKGWNTKNDGTGAWVTKDDITTFEIDKIYAIWEKTSESTKLMFDNQNIDLFYSENIQTRIIAGAHGGIGSYTYEKTSGESNILVSSDGVITIPGRKAIGTYSLNIKVKDGVNNTTSGTITITISKNNNNSRCPTLTLYTGTYDGQSHTIKIGNDGYGGNGWTLQYRTSTTESWTTTKPTRTNAGTTTVYVRVVPGNSHYNLKDCGSSTITINKADAICSSGTNYAAYSGTYDGRSHTITATGQTGGTLQYRTSTTESWTTTKPTRTNAGTTTVYVQVAGDSNHNTKDCGSKTITINKATLTCPSSPSDKAYTGDSQSSGIPCPSGSTVGGTTSAIARGTYKQTCTADSNHQFASACEVSWKIKCIPGFNTATPVGQRVTFGGKTWSVIVNNSGSNVYLALYGVSSQNSGTFNSSTATSATEAAISDVPTAFKNECVINQGTANTETDPPGNLYWTKDSHFYSNVEVNRQVTTCEGYGSGLGFSSNTTANAEPIGTVKLCTGKTFSNYGNIKVGINSFRGDYMYYAENTSQIKSDTDCDSGGVGLNICGGKIEESNANYSSGVRYWSHSGTQIKIKKPSSNANTSINIQPMIYTFNTVTPTGGFIQGNLTTIGDTIKDVGKLKVQICGGSKTTNHHGQYAVAMYNNKNTEVAGKTHQSNGDSPTNWFRYANQATGVGTWSNGTVQTDSLEYLKYADNWVLEAAGDVGTEGASSSFQALGADSNYYDRTEYRYYFNVNSNCRGNITTLDMKAKNIGRIYYRPYIKVLTN